MKHLTTTLVLLIINVAIGQSGFNSESMEVTRGDLETNFYAKDTTANAIVLYEYGNSYIKQDNFWLYTDIKKKIKILNRNAFDKATIEEILYHDGSNKERIDNIVAATFNLESNGSISSTRLDKKNVYEEKYNDKYNLTKFTLPDVREGSVITCTYTAITPYKYKYREWKFQDDIPKLHSEYHTSIPGNWEYNIKLVGYKKLDKNDVKLKPRCLEGGNGAYADCTESVYVMNDVPAFIEEDNMTSKNNYLSRIEYELKTLTAFDGRVENYTKTWKNTDKEIKTMPEIGRQLGKSSILKDLLDASITNETDPLKKAKAIYNYVLDNYTWNGKYQIFRDVSVKDLVKNKSGKASEINMLLYNLLEDNDIKVMPVLLSTRENGFPTKIYPVISDFNYFLVQATINGKTYLLDATDKYQSFGEIPFKCLNHYGRLMDFDTGSYFIDIVPDKASVVHYRVELNLDENQKLSGTIASRTSGYNALPLKRSYFGNPQEYLKDLENKYHDITFLDHKVTTEDKTSFDFTESFDIEYNDVAVADILYINPFVFKFFTENPFKLQERTYPIDFGYERAFLYNMKITLDKGYEIIEIPKDISLTLPNNKGVLVLSSQIQNNSILLYFKINLNESLYGQEYYGYLKEFFTKIVDIQKNELIVLKKI